MVGHRALDVLARWAWPTVLIARFVAYALTDRPPHFLLWEASRGQHASLYLLAALLVAVTLRRVQSRVLVAKAVFVTGIALGSMWGDLFVGRGARPWLSLTAWGLLLVGNLIVVAFRLANLDEKGRA